MGTEARRTRSSLNGIRAGIRRLIIAYAGYRVIDRATDAIRGFFTETLKYTREIERARLGVATLFTALGQVNDASGRATQGAEKLSTSFGIADDQLKKLRASSLQTAATFDQLANAFQIAIGPGFGAGLNIDEIRQFSVQASQAAFALGVAQNQLSEEIRSVLTGTIRSRDTRLVELFPEGAAEANRLIQEARKAGNLFEFLNKRFAAFTDAGEELSKTFVARLTNAKDAILLLTQEAAVGFFDETKGFLKDVADSAVEIDQQVGTLQARTQGVDFFRGIFDGLRRATESFREFVSNIDFTSLVTGARVFGDALSVISAILLDIAQGAVEGIGVIAESLDLAANAAVALSKFLFPDADLDRIRNALQNFGQILAIVFALRGAFLVITAILSPFAAAAAFLVASLSVAADEGRRLAQAITGLEDPDLATFGVALVEEIQAAGAKGAAALKLAIKLALLQIPPEIGKTMAEALTVIVGAIDQLPIIGGKLGFEAGKALGQSFGAAVEANLNSEQAVVNTFAEFNARIAEINRNLDKNKNDAVKAKRDLDAAAKAGKDVEEQTTAAGKAVVDLSRALKDISDFLPGVFDEKSLAEKIRGLNEELFGTKDALKDSVDEAKNLGEVIGKVRPTAEEARKRVRTAVRNDLRGGVEVPVLLDLGDALGQAATLQEQIFEAVALKEEETGEAIESFSDFFSAVGSVIDDFFSDVTVESLLANFTSGALTGALGALGNPGQGGGDTPQSGGARTQIGDVNAQLEVANAKSRTWQQTVELVGQQLGVAVTPIEAINAATGGAATSAGVFQGAVAGAVASASALNQTGQILASTYGAAAAAAERLAAALKAAGLGGGGGGGGSSSGPTSSGVTSGNAGGASTGFHRGGRVGTRGRATLAHAFAPGFNLGGPPAGVHPSDTVPAWLTPGA